MRSLLSRIFGLEASTNRPARRRPVRLGLEHLGERVLPAITALDSPVDVSGQTFGNQNAVGERTVARAVNGNYAVTWSASNSDGSNGVFVRLFNAGGTALTAPIRVNATSAYSIQPSIAMNANGQFAVAWTHYNSSDSDVRVQRFNASGGKVGGEVVVANEILQNEMEPSAALDNSGNLMVAYSTDLAPTDREILVWRQSAGRAIGTTRITGTPANDTSPSLALNANGQGVVAWVSNMNNSLTTDVHIQRLTSSGTLVGVYITPANFTFAAARWDPSVAINSSGNFVVGYNEKTTSTSTAQVLVSRFNSAGTFLGRVSVDDPADTRAELNPSVSMDDFGRFVVAYTHVYSSSDLDVRAQAFDGNGTALGGSVFVSGSDVFHEFNPSVALGNDGQFIVSFQTYGQKRTSSGQPANGVSARRFTLGRTFNFTPINGTFSTTNG